MVRYWARRGLLGHGVVDGLTVDCDDDGTVVSVSPGHAVAPTGATVLGGADGLLLPGLVDHHSHAFHRALRGRAAGGDFWAWRAGMYRLVDRLCPETLVDLAAAAYGELLLAGITTVHEFHYLHGPAGMDDAVAEAARRAGIRLVLLDTCYLRAGFHDTDGDGLDEAQRRFSDGDVEAWASRADGVAKANPDITVGAAIHSVRAVDERSMGVVAGWARERAVPLHLHLSEQIAENEACVAATGRSPSALAADLDVLGPGTTVVHATNITAEDAALLGWSGTDVCLCPTTERDLADGIGPARALADAGCRLTVGTDSHAVVDLFEEARAIELDQRLATGQRGLHTPAELLAAATGGATIEVGRPADLCAVDLDSVRLAGADPEDLVSMVVAAATSADVADTVVGGRHVVADRRHGGMDVAAALRSAIEAVTS